MITNAMNSALQGMQANQKNFLNSAQRISRFGSSSSEGSLAKDMTNLLTSRRGYEANLVVAKTADEMLGTLLDTFA